MTVKSTGISRKKDTAPTAQQIYKLKARLSQKINKTQRIFERLSHLYHRNVMNTHANFVLFYGGSPLSVSLLASITIRQSTAYL